MIAIFSTSAGAVVLLAIGMAGWMFKVHGLLSAILEALKGIPVLFTRTDDHGKRIARLEGRHAENDCEGV